MQHIYQVYKVEQSITIILNWCFLSGLFKKNGAWNCLWILKCPEMLGDMQGPYWVTEYGPYVLTIMLGLKHKKMFWLSSQDIQLTTKENA